MTLPIGRTRLTRPARSSPTGPGRAETPAARFSQLPSVASLNVHPARYVGIVVLLLIVLLLQRTVLARLDIPFGTPDLLAIVVAAVALQTGPGLGALTGFVAGFGADLLSDHAMGRLPPPLCTVRYPGGPAPAEPGESAAAPP